MQANKVHLPVGKMIKDTLTKCLWTSIRTCNNSKGSNINFPVSGLAAKRNHGKKEGMGARVFRSDRSPVEDYALFIMGLIWSSYLYIICIYLIQVSWESSNTNIPLLWDLLKFFPKISNDKSHCRNNLQECWKKFKTFNNSEINRLDF